MFWRFCRKPPLEHYWEFFEWSPGKCLFAPPAPRKPPFQKCRSCLRTEKGIDFVNYIDNILFFFSLFGSPLSTRRLVCSSIRAKTKEWKGRWCVKHHFCQFSCMGFYLVFLVSSRFPKKTRIILWKAKTKYYLLASFHDIWPESKSSKLDIQKAISAKRIRAGRRERGLDANAADAVYFSGTRTRTR